MHTVELLDQAITAAKLLGVKFREDWLGGAGGGVCEIKGQRWVFLDLSQGPADHLDLVVEAIRGDVGLLNLDLPPQLESMVQLRLSA